MMPGCLPRLKLALDPATTQHIDCLHQAPHLSLKCKIFEHRNGHPMSGSAYWSIWPSCSLSMPSCDRSAEAFLSGEKLLARFAPNPPYGYASSRPGPQEGCLQIVAIVRHLAWTADASKILSAVCE